ncbi:ferric reductase NAD binding domain-domain-containing protein [Coniella lustricola]|uniref:ferric-chelate reductase (NADPH) n=1 Tax=Coniella lustricola TaxID=2025994 RepID=A0A2T3ANJ2_9PEZI|nr:ferric reductase NAD binding domain-domain-containing protein [Coniella lustricola]
MAIAWLMYPLMYHSSRDPGECTMTPEQCYYKSRTFRNWYIADLVYGRGTVYFFLITILLCVAGFWALKTSPAALRARASWQKSVAVFRFTAYRRYEIKAIGYQTPTLGVMAILAVGFIFFTAMTLGPKPYYWPSTASFGDSPPLATRAGWMALGATPFMILFATKANMIASLAGVSHEKFIVFHTWLAWAVLVLALIHTFPFIVYNYREKMMTMQWATNFSYWTGVAAIVPQGYLTFMSVPWIRNACYEFFKATHYFMAIVFMVFFFIHCGFTLTSADYFVVAGVLYACSWCYSQMKTYFDHGIRRRATITPLSDRCLRIDVPVGPLTLWKPGQHMFLRFLTLGVHAFTAHPFTICSLPDGDKLVGQPQSVMSFYVKPRGGFTGRLAAAATKQGNNGSVTVPVLLEGAYGGLHGRPLTEYSRALVIACGSGSGFSLPFVMEWIAATARRNTATNARSDTESKPNTESSTVKPNKMTVVIATRDASTAEWYEAALTEYLETQKLELQPGSIEILLHLTTSADDSDDSDANSKAASSPIDSEKRGIPHSPSAQSLATSNGTNSHNNKFGIKILHGRPDMARAVRDVTSEQDVASVGIAVCGPTAVLAAVRDEAAAAELRIVKSAPGPKEVYLYSEMFGW